MLNFNRQMYQIGKELMKETKKKSLFIKCWGERSVQGHIKKRKKDRERDKGNLFKTGFNDIMSFSMWFSW